LDNGLASPTHTHTHDYYSIVISGTVTNPFEGEEDPPEMGPGDAWCVPGGAVHRIACVSEEPCLFHTHGDALWDLQLVGKPDDAPGEGG
jgi:quercetin dioxygenase-like cupin family protein